MPRISESTNIDNIQLQEQASAPTTPASGFARVYAKNDGTLHFVNDAGTDTELSGDVNGPASATDNAIARFNGTGGKTLQNSGVTIDDNNTLSGVTAIVPAAASELTIATGAVTITNFIHSIDTEADAASDDLDTINGVSAGEFGLISANNAARTVNLTHGVGNVFTFTGSTVALDETYKYAWYVGDGTNVYITGVGGTGGGGMTSFTVAGDSGGGQSITDGNTLTIAGGTGIVTADSATDTVTIDLDVNSLTSDGTPDGAADYVPTYDASAAGHKKILLHNIPKLLMTVTNDSGATANAGDVGYIDETGKYKTTTTEAFSGNWCVVITGAANGAAIKVQTRGNATVNYTGTAPSAGHYLITSTTGGSATRSTTMRPEIFAVCTGSGSGGSVSVLLLTQTKPVAATSSNNVLSIVTHSTTDFQATINGAPTTTSVVYNAPTSGNEDVIEPSATDEIGKMVLWNTTRGTSRLITATNTGTNTITTVSSADSWANGDSIEIRSQTVSNGSPYYIDVDLSQSTEVPILARAAVFYVRKDDSGAAGESLLMHPFTTYGTGSQIVFRNAYSSPAASGFAEMTMPLYNRKFAFGGSASGSATSTTIIRLSGYQLAAP